MSARAHLPVMGGESWYCVWMDGEWDGRDVVIVAEGRPRGGVSGFWVALERQTMVLSLRTSTNGLAENNQ